MSRSVTPFYSPALGQADNASLSREPKNLLVICKRLLLSQFVRCPLYFEVPEHNQSNEIITAD